MFFFIPLPSHCFDHSHLELSTLLHSISCGVATSRDKMQKQFYTFTLICLIYINRTKLFKNKIVHLPVALGFSKLFPLYMLFMSSATYFDLPFSAFALSPETADMLIRRSHWVQSTAPRERSAPYKNKLSFRKAYLSIIIYDFPIKILVNLFYYNNQLKRKIWERMLLHS